MKTSLYILSISLALILNGCQNPLESERIAELECENWLDNGSGSWKLVVEHPGHAELELISHDVKRRFEMIGELDVLNEAFREFDFFLLPDDIGRPRPSGGELRMKVTTNKGRQKQVRVFRIKEEDIDDDVRHLLRFWGLVRGTFEDERAYDLRSHDSYWMALGEPEEALGAKSAE